jgi:hypothetical protein
VNVTIVDVPAVLALGMSAAGEVGHAPIEARLSGPSKLALRRGEAKETAPAPGLDRAGAILSPSGLPRPAPAAPTASGPNTPRLGSLLAGPPVHAGGFFIHLASVCEALIRVFTILGIEHALSIPIERPQSRDSWFSHIQGNNLYSAQG